VTERNKILKLKMLIKMKKKSKLKKISLKN